MKLTAAHVKVQRLLVEMSTRRKLRRRRMPRSRSPRSQRIAYATELRNLARACAQLIRDVVFPDLPKIVAEAARFKHDSVRTDALHDTLETTIGATKFRLGRLVTDDSAKQIATKAAKNVNEFNKADINRQLKAVVGIELSAEPTVDAYLPVFIRENVKLIKSIPEVMLDQVEGIINRGAREGLRQEEIASQLEERFGVAESKAEGIARDQVGSLNGMLTEIRQTNIGATKYTWRNSQDERVRGNPDGLYPKADPSHWEREGLVYSWDDPPEGGHPGLAINCRCSAEMIVDDVLEAFDL